jgi:hypothetical protein
MDRKEKAEYIKRWKAYIEPLHLLEFTPSKEISSIASYLIGQLEVLIVMVADDKCKKESA